MTGAGRLAVRSAGLVSGLGTTLAECAAAIRFGANAFQPTRFIGRHGGWITGSPAPLEPGLMGHARLVRMAATAISECVGATAEPLPILLAVAEESRPGRLQGLDTLLLGEVARACGMPLHAASRIIPMGRVGGAVGLLSARRLLTEGAPQVVVAGVDSLLVHKTIEALDASERLLTEANSNGFIPGEAAAAILVGPPANAHEAPITVEGLGFAREASPIGSGKPLRADGLVDAIRAALNNAGVAIEDCDHRFADVSGEHYTFREASLAVTRLLRVRREVFGIWHLADCIGEIGAATLPAMLAVSLRAVVGDYLPGNVLLGHLGNDDGRRAAFVARAMMAQTLAPQRIAQAAP